MSDRLTVKRVLNLGDYEHISVELSTDVIGADASDVMNLVARVDAYAKNSAKLVKLTAEQERLKENIRYEEQQLLRYREAEYASWPGEEKEHMAELSKKRIAEWSQRIGDAQEQFDALAKGEWE